MLTASSSRQHGNCTPREWSSEPLRRPASSAATYLRHGNGNNHQRSEWTLFPVTAGSLYISDRKPEPILEVNTKDAVKRKEPLWLYLLHKAVLLTLDFFFLPKFSKPIGFWVPMTL